MQQAAAHAAGDKVLAKKVKLRRRSFATADLSDERARTVGSSRMNKRHAHLDSVLKQK
jgi:hypothetical protein